MRTYAVGATLAQFLSVLKICMVTESKKMYDFNFFGGM